MLTGKFERSLDDKQRFAIPKRLREFLQLAAKSALFIAPGTDGSLALYTEEAFAQLARRLDAASPTGKDLRAFSRLFYARAQEVELDPQGRIRIPSDLAELAELGKQVVLLGVGDHLEIWNHERWKQYLNSRAPQYDHIAEKAFQPHDPHDSE